MTKEVSKGFIMEITFFVHATEDEQKLFDVIKANFNLLPENFKQNILEGHYGNPIYKYTASIKSNLAQHVLRTIFGRLDVIDKNFLIESIEKRVDEHKNLHLRIEKSSLFKKFFRLGTANVIHLKLIPKNKNLKNIKNFYENLLLRLEGQ